MKIGIIDNYDSFTYNLVQLLGAVAGHADILVWRNDQIDLPLLDDARLTHLVISPGPGPPNDAGISRAALRHFSGRIPILGVCLGHQCMAHSFGGTVTRASRLIHGKTSWIHHDSRGLFQGLPSPFPAARYHSLIVDPASLPKGFHISAWTDQGEIMALRHQTWPMEGVQFHPESFMTHHGARLAQNFLAWAAVTQAQPAPA